MIENVCAREGDVDVEDEKQSSFRRMLLPWSDVLRVFDRGILARSA